jgi:hypothetical protein
MVEVVGNQNSAFNREDGRHDERSRRAVYESVRHEIRQRVPFLHLVLPGLVTSLHRNEFKHECSVHAKILECHASRDTFERAKPRCILGRREQKKSTE